MLLKKESLQVVCLFHIVIVLTLLVAIFRLFPIVGYRLFFNNLNDFPITLADIFVPNFNRSVFVIIRE